MSYLKVLQIKEIKIVPNTKLRDGLYKMCNLIIKSQDFNVKFFFIIKSLTEVTLNVCFERFIHYQY